MDMEPARNCPSCGTPLPTDAPEGLCVKCLLKVGGSDATTRPDSGAEKRQTVAPPPGEIAKYFPQLEVLELLGQGGMGMVYKARQPQLDRLIALKILPPELSRDSAFAERFNREARALARLNHPNIIAVHDFGRSGEFYYFIMEYVDGMNLWQLEQTKKRLQPGEALALIPKICEALQYAHDEGVVHRDIKPGNILISKKGRVKIADFGLARMLGVESRDVRLTGSRDMMGTLQYMAPEQVEHPQEVDHRADIYSLGVVFYEMLTGELPMGRFSPPSQKVQVDVRLDEVVLRALEKEPSRRYQQASEVKTDVETIAAAMEQLAATQRARRSARPAVSDWATALGKRRTWLSVSAAVAAILFAVFFGPKIMDSLHLRKTKAPPPQSSTSSRALSARSGPRASAGILFHTGFEAEEGYVAGQPLIGQQGWRAGPWQAEAPTSGDGVASNLLPDSPQQGFVGGVAGFVKADLATLRIIERTIPELEAGDGAEVEISWQQLISDSTNGGRNDFEWLFWASDNRFLGGLGFDNGTQGIFRQNENWEDTRETGLTFRRGQVYSVKVLFDFSENRWTASVGTNALRALPITASSNASSLLSLHTMNLNWFGKREQTRSGMVAGDNRLVFDDLTVLARSSRAVRGERSGDAK